MKTVTSSRRLRCGYNLERKATRSRDALALAYKLLSITWYPEHTASDRQFKPVDPNSEWAEYFSIGGAVQAVTASELASSEAMTFISIACEILTGRPAMCWEMEFPRSRDEVLWLIRSAIRVLDEGVLTPLCVFLTDDSALDSKLRASAKTAYSFITACRCDVQVAA